MVICFALRENVKRVERVIDLLRTDALTSVTQSI